MPIYSGHLGEPLSLCRSCGKDSLTGIGEWGDVSWDEPPLKRFQGTIVKSYVRAALIGFALAGVAAICFAVTDPGPMRYDPYGQQIPIQPVTHYSVETALFIFPLLLVFLYWMEVKTSSQKRVALQNSDPRILRIREIGERVRQDERDSALQEKKLRKSQQSKSKWFQSGRYSQLLVLALMGAWVIGVAAFEGFVTKHSSLRQAFLLWVPALVIGPIAFWWLADPRSDKSGR